MCLDFGASKTIDFPFGTNGKLMILGVPILKHFRVNHEVMELQNRVFMSETMKDLILKIYVIWAWAKFMTEL